MGFKFKRVVFHGRSTGTTSTGYSYNWSTNSSKIDRAKDVVTEVAEVLISMNIGWELDSSYNDSLTSYLDILYMGSNESEPYMPGLILRNIESQNKLFISYIAAYCDGGIQLPISQLMPAGDIINPSYTGLIMSMIPGDSGQVFGEPLGQDFIPSSATRVYGTCEAYGKTGVSTSYARSNNAVYYCWGILATPYCVGVSSGYSSDTTPSTLKPCFFCGRVLGSLSHEETLPQSKYGVVQFTQSIGGSNAEAGNIKSVSINFGDAYEDTISTPSFTTSFSEGQGSRYNMSSGHVFKVNGSPIGHTSTSNIRVYPENYGQLSGYTKLSDSNVRWVPYIVSVISTDLQNDGIIPGDGVKGYLDTDLFRCARVSSGQYLNNHIFVGFGNNLLLGWDVENTEEL